MAGRQNEAHDDVLKKMLNFLQNFRSIMESERRPSIGMCPVHLCQKEDDNNNKRGSYAWRI